MSWSFTKTATREEATLKFKDVVRAQYAYNSSAGPLLDLIAEFAIAAARQPGHAETCETTLSSSGHVDASGYGTVNVALAFAVPVPPVASAEAEPAPKKKKA